MKPEDFEVKSYPDLWESIGMDVERFEKMRCFLGDTYQRTFLTQENRPDSMAYFNWLVSEIHGARIMEIHAARKSGRPVVGTFCIFVPEELVLAARGICYAICGGSHAPVSDAEKVLPRNICPMVKSAYGFKLAKVCPYFQSVDFVYGETTCDAKKKTWEHLEKMVPVHVMEIPQMKRRQDRTLWLEEVSIFKSQMENVTGREIRYEDIRESIILMNNKRRALQRLNRLQHHCPSVISGKDVLLIEQIAFFDEPGRFTEKVNNLCDELDERIAEGNYVAPASAPRVLISGTPMAMPNWKAHDLVETLGGVIVNDESCVGTRYFKDLVDEELATIEDQLGALTDRYMNIDCACFTPNSERVEQVLKEYRESGAQGILHYSLQFCNIYLIEAIKIQEACEIEGIPFLSIESDYSPEDIGQMQTRIEAFLEQIKG